MSVDLLLYIIAFICLLLESVGVGAPRVKLGWLGLALFVLTFII